MKRVWKVASRWSEDGHEESSILDIFRAHQVVFVGKRQTQFGLIEPGDLITISDGRTVVALGIVTSPAAAVTELGISFTEAEQAQFEYDDWVTGCRVAFSDLPEKNWIPCPPGTFHQVHERADHFRQLHQELHQRFEEHQEFEIQARSCTLLRNSRQPEHTLWRTEVVFRVPVYQRAYSWKEAEVRRLVGDLLAAFRGSNGRPVQEPMFIGTMQLTERKLLDSEGRMLQEVIDGQQRLSTLILLLKLLRDRAPDLKVWGEVAIESRLRTAVSSGAQQAYLDEALLTNSLEGYEARQNPYLEVVPVIQSLLDDGVAAEEETPDEALREPAPLDVESFTAYLVSRVYFVVIETRATLSKTLQIFDAINTSGMDLNGADVFKVRFYEYLQVTKKVGEDEFEHISALYQAVDEGNRAAGWQVCGMEDILSLTRHLLVARHKMAKILHDFNAASFFDRFFDTVLSVNKWPNFSQSTCREIAVTREELKRLIQARFDWERRIPGLSAEVRCFLEFIWHSRYSKYAYLTVLFWDRYQPEPAAMESFILRLAKLFVIFSIVYWRTVNELHGIMHRLLEMAFDADSSATPEEVIAFLHQMTMKQKETITHALMTYTLADNPKAKALACQLSALLHELERVHEHTAEGLRALIFDTEIDIEHIESVNHKDELERVRIQAEWGIELNGIGNLMVLERSLNRSISNEGYQSVKIHAYRSQSSFRAVNLHAATYLEWDLAACKRRKEIEVGRLLNCLCG